MGLSGRKEKQRIGADPRNLAWADDAAKFGSSYLSKFGWDSSKGLGVEGEGRISHIKVSQKLDLFGIGAAQQKDPNGIAWKQNKDFERLLERLNATAEAEVKNEEEEEEIPKQEDATEKKKRKKSEPMPVEAAKPLVPRHRAHRARAIAAKNMASKSAISVSEILGIAPTPSTGASTTPLGTLTPASEEVVHEKLTTSTKSVADYFKDKLLAKAGKSETSTPTPEIKPEMDYDNAPRGGLGSSRVKLELREDVVDLDQQPRIGLSATLASSFFAATLISVAIKEEEVQIDDVNAQKKKKRSSTEEETDSRKRKDKKGKRRRDEEVESAAASTAMEDDASEKRKKRRRRDEESEPAATPEDASEKKKKRRRRDEGSASANQEEGDVKVEMVDEDERKKAKKERKRLKALRKEGNVA